MDAGAAVTCSCRARRLIVEKPSIELPHPLLWLPLGLSLFHSVRGLLWLGAKHLLAVDMNNSWNLRKFLP